MKRLLYSLIVLFCLLGQQAVAQKSTRNIAPYLIYVKFPDDTDYEVTDKALILPGHQQDTRLNELKELGWWSRVHRLPKEQLTAYRRTAEKNLGKKLPDMNAEFHFHLYKADKISDAIQLLKVLPGVKKVLEVPVPINAQAPDYTSFQGYAQSVSSGINADSATLVYNNRGTGIGICDIEYSYNGNHLDHPAVPLLSAPYYDPFNSTDHGTAVLGIIGSKNNTEGTTGIASDSRLYFSAACTLPDSTYNLARAVTDALPALVAGDIILFEQQIPGPNYDPARTDQFGLVPIEWFEPYYFMVQLASGLGITIVEAAGNGQQNLDAPEYNTGSHTPFLPGNSSGAIIVGAGSAGVARSGTDSARSRLWYSNYGSRIDVQGNGERIYTTGYGSLYATEGINRFYTDDFGGTSGASPIVVGAVALMQSIHKQNAGGQVLSTATILSALKATGKPQSSSTLYPAATYPIGPLPNVYQAITRILASLSVTTTPAGRNHVNLYPNPSNGTVTLSWNKLPNETLLQINIVDAIGRNIRQLQANAAHNMMQVNLSGLPSGWYTVKTSSGIRQETNRLLLKQ